jgi:hypothetical protein
MSRESRLPCTNFVWYVKWAYYSKLLAQVCEVPDCDGSAGRTMVSLSLRSKGRLEDVHFLLQHEKVVLCRVGERHRAHHLFE